MSLYENTLQAALPAFLIKIVEYAHRGLCIVYRLKLQYINQGRVLFWAMLIALFLISAMRKV